MGEELSWLIEAISTLAKAEGWPEQVIKKMGVLGERLSFGIDFRGLVQNGYDTPKALSELSIEHLEKMLPRDLARRTAKSLRPSASGVIDRPVKVQRPSSKKSKRL